MNDSMKQLAGVILGVALALMMPSIAAQGYELGYQGDTYQLRDEGTELERYEGTVGTDVSNGFRLISLTINGLKNTTAEDMGRMVPISIPRLHTTNVPPQGELRALLRNQYLSKGFQLRPALWQQNQCPFRSFVFNHPMRGFKEKDAHGADLMALHSNRDGVYVPTILGENCGKSAQPSRYSFTFYSGNAARLTAVSVKKNNRVLYTENRMNFERGRIDFAWNGIDSKTQKPAHPGKYQLSYDFEVQRFGRVSSFSKTVVFSHHPDWLR